MRTSASRSYSASRSKPSPTSPTGTTRPFRRTMRTAALAISSPLAVAVTITVSAPSRSDQPSTAASASSGVTTSSAPSPAASSRRRSTGSTPTTRHPAARTICTVSSPSRPSPTTTTRSPSAGSARRTPCSAIAPIAPNAACVWATPSGTAQARFPGTETTSAWFARPAPAQATRWPTRKSASPPVSMHGARARVAERRVGRRRAADEVDRLAHPVLACVLEGLADEVRIANRARRQRPGASRDDGTFRPAGDRRGGVRDEQRPRRRAGSGRVDDLCLAVAHDDLLHRRQASGALGGRAGSLSCCCGQSPQDPFCRRHAPEHDEDRADRGRARSATGRVRARAGRHGTALRPRDVRDLPRGARRRRAGLLARRRVGVARAADRARDGAARAGAAGGGAGRGARPGRRELDGGRGA